MSTRNTTTDQRRRAKVAAARREHRDKYADTRLDPDERRMSGLVADLAAHFDGEGADRGGR